MMDLLKGCAWKSTGSASPLASQAYLPCVGYNTSERNDTIRQYATEGPSMGFHPVTQTILDLLTVQHCWHETFEHQPVRTSEEAAKARPGYTLRQGAKAMIVRAKVNGGDKQFLMLVIPADQKFSN